MLHEYFNNKQIKKYKKDIDAINDIYTKNKEIKDKDLVKMLLNLRNGNSSKKHKINNAIAIAKEASEVSLGMSYYDVQIMGALALIEGKIAQMKTGEGKTLMCSAAVAANFALGYKTHVATANEYLASRDEETLQPLYRALGISSASNIAGQGIEEKKDAYSKDVLYSTSQEMGFDYLRDNLVKDIHEKIQPQDYSNVIAIIDEADFILIDEARTPLIISGSSSPQGDEFYHKVKAIAVSLKKMAYEPVKSLTGEYDTAPGDFWVDYKTRSIYLAEDGYHAVEKLLTEQALMTGTNLYTRDNLWLVEEVLNALKAQYLYIIDKQYVVQDGEVVIVDENTGRLSVGRSWSDGLHQAIEAKENLQINSMTSTLRTISIQNYFRHYGKISGMTGTAAVCREEFDEIYNCPVVEIPTNRAMIRKDYPDRVFMEAKYKYQAIVKDIKNRHEKGQPILVGTTSVNESELISKMLTEQKIFHYVLNAKNHSLEAQIISQAGISGAVTVATSMAGRGTDIILGGNKEEIIKSKQHQIGNLEYITQMILQSLEKNGESVQYTDLVETSSYDFSNLVNIQNFIQETHGKGYERETEALKTDLNDSLLLQGLLKNQITEIEENWKANRQKSVDAGGLCIIGCSRNESRRIDDQIRGRAGRQGDVGESAFYISFEDNWLQVFARSSMFKVLRNNLEPDQPITSSFVSSSIEKAQRSIEGMYFDNRKNTFQYDSVLNESRVNFFKIRDSMITDNSLVKTILLQSVKDNLQKIEDMHYVLSEQIKVEDKIYSISDAMDSVLDNSGDFEHRKEIFLKVLQNLFDLNPQNAFKLMHIIGLQKFWEKVESGAVKTDEDFKQILETGIMDYFSFMEDDFWTWFKARCLEDLDNLWIDYLSITEEIRNSSGLVTMAQKNPLYEYKRSCYELFKNFIEKFRDTMLDGMMDKISFTDREELPEELAA
jgi:preprotein translocase subunit SecA